MTDLQFSDVANIVSVISGLMTIFGVGGFMSWTFLKKEKGSLTDNSISIFAFSVKTGCCMLLLWPMFFLFSTVHIFVVLSLGSGAIGSEQFFWDANYPFAYSVSYVIGVLLLGPLYILTCSSIYVWSLKPFVEFFRAFRR